MKEWILKIIRGVVIGLANAVPGVSGGTMMVSMGIYDTLIHCITHLFKEFKKSIGEAPTIRDDNIPIVEMHLFNAAEDLYGVEMTVEFHAFLRKSMKFDSVSSLEAQIRRDINEARIILADSSATT